jgi:hypothetical protein
LLTVQGAGRSAPSGGIDILPRDVAPGTLIVKALALDDVLLEVNVTPNRPDALSHVGIAREAAAAFGRRVVLPAFRLAEGGGPAADAVRVRIEAPEKCHRYLLAVPGIGPWTADVVAMRALGAPDAFPAGDLGVQRALGVRSARAAEARAEGWRPWRAYATAHLWTLLGDRAGEGGGA